MISISSCPIQREQFIPPDVSVSISRHLSKGGQIRQIIKRTAKQMKLSIRLQNHGCKNHPLWWIVVAPNRKNIRGRFIEHVGYWSPRHGVNMKRQIIFNMPRVKYWMSNGAVPTFKVHKFLSMWNILPEPWYYKKTEQERQAEKKPESEMNEKQKRKLEWKKRRKEKQDEEISPHHYYYPEARAKMIGQRNNFKRKMDAQIQAQEEENQIIRDMLLVNEFSKVAKVNELSGKSTFDDSEELQRLEEKLKKAKAELGLIRANFQNSHPSHQSKIMKQINELCEQIKVVQKSRRQSISEQLKLITEEEGEYLSEDLLKLKLSYELVVKKLEKNEEEMDKFGDLSEPVLLQEYADFLVQNESMAPERAYTEAQREFIRRGEKGQPMTKYELAMYDELKDKRKRQSQTELSDHPLMKDADAWTLLRRAVEYGDCVLPVHRSVHPMPDLRKYIPEEYYEPLVQHSPKIQTHNPLTPLEELEQYKKVKHQSKSQYQGIRVNETQEFVRVSGGDKARKVII